MENKVVDYVISYAKENNKDEVHALYQSMLLVYVQLCKNVTVPTECEFIDDTRLQIQKFLFNKIIAPAIKVAEVADHNEFEKIVNVTSRLYNYIDSVAKGDPLTMDELLSGDYDLSHFESNKGGK